MTGGEATVKGLLSEARLAPPHELPGILSRHLAAVGCAEALAYLADLQQNVLIPFVDPDEVEGQATPLAVDSTLAGWVFQRMEVQVQELPGGAARVWLPIVDGAERLGVLAVRVDDRAVVAGESEPLLDELHSVALLLAELIVTKTLYGDTIVRLRRQADMGLAAEIQWSLLPPLTFASTNLAIAATLEPAYEVAGDTVDYAINSDRAHAAVFDAMGHGMQAAQLAVLAVAAYRHARRRGRPLAETATAIDGAVSAAFGGDAFATGVLVELDTATGAMRWLSAGHPEPLLLREGALVKTLHVEPVLPFGLSSLAPGVGPSVGTESLEPGDRVVFYTDGAVEARSPAGEFFGIARLTDLILRHLASGLAAPETMRRVTRALLEHQQGQLDDDATLLLVEWRCDEGMFTF